MSVIFRVINWINLCFRYTYGLGFRLCIRSTGVLLANGNLDLAYSYKYDKRIWGDQSCLAKWQIQLFSLVYCLQFPHILHQNSFHNLGLDIHAILLGPLSTNR